MSRRKRSTSTRFSLFAFQDIITCVMGIMLLLTLLMCLQIAETVTTPSASDAASRMQELQTDVDRVRREVAGLAQQVADQSALLESGALNNVQLLRDKQNDVAAAKTASESELAVLLQKSLTADKALSELKSDSGQKQQLRADEIARLLAEARRQESVLKSMLDGTRIVYNRHLGVSDTCWIIEVSSDSDFKAAPIGKSQPPESFSSIDAVLTWVRQRHQEGAEFLILLKPTAAEAIDRIPGTLREEGIPHGYDLLADGQTALHPETGATAL